MVYFWRKMQQEQLLTCFSTWFELWGDEGELEGGGSKLRWARCKERRALSSWASLSSSMNFKCSEEGDDSGVWLLSWMDVWTCNIGVACEFVGGGGDTLGGGDICELE
jgi:hypothetical protein